MSTILACAVLLWQAAEPTAAPEYVQRYLQRCEEAHVPRLPLAMPPAKDGVGIFLPAIPNDARHGRSVDVLEVVGPHDAIVRAWYIPAAPPDASEVDSEATLIDLWVRGVDAQKWVAGSPVKLEQVFHVSGSKSFGTVCGGRSVPLLEVVDLERFGKNRQQ